MNTIKQERRWCVRNWGKKPCVTADGGQWKDPSNWLSYEDAKALFEAYPNKFTGMGVFLSESEQDSNLLLCGIDIDAKDHNPQTPNPLAPEVLEMFKGTYAELSPSRSGYHILLYVRREDFPYLIGEYPFYKKNDKKDLEAYVPETTTRYFTFTGERLEGYSDTITDQTDAFIQFLKKYMRKPERKRAFSADRSQLSPAYDETEPDFDVDKRITLLRNSPRGKRFAELFDEGNTSGYRSASEADFALLCMLVPWLEGNVTAIDRAYRQSALYNNGRDEKWDSKRGSSTWGRNSILAAIDSVDEPYYTDDPEYATGDSISPEDIVKMIDEVQQDKEKSGKVTVLPFACGLGKSTAVSLKIAEVLQSEGTDGLIVVTDSIERMYEYPAPRNTRYSSLKEYLSEHKDEISILSAASIKEERARQFSCRVLIMSTQRYFQQLTREQIIGYTDWAEGERTLVIIDEQPGVLEQRVLTMETVNAVGEALQSIEPYNDETDEQDWCIEQWDKVINIIKAEDKKYRRKEKSNEETAYYFVHNNNSQLTENDERFSQFVNSNVRALIEHGDAIGTICAARQLLTEWGIVERSRAKNRWNIKFVSLIDHQDKINDIGAKVIILDGTADLSPEYNSDLYDIRASSACRRRLDRLRLHLVNVPTTRDAVLQSDAQALAEKIKNFAWRKNKGAGNRSVVFTYKAKLTNGKQLETELEELFNNEGSPCNVNHFGAVRGKNIYKNCNFFIQYGLYQFPRSSYMLYAIHADSELFANLKEADETEASNMLKQLEHSSIVEKIRSQLILTDIEQNFFRGSIRVTNCEQQMDYYVFFSLGKYGELINMMQLRYFSLGVSINCMHDRPQEFRSDLGYRKDSNADKVRQFLEKLPPGRFEKADIKEKLGLTSNQLSDVIRNHQDINKTLKSWECKPGKYCKKRKRKYKKTINQTKKQPSILPP